MMNQGKQKPYQETELLAMPNVVPEGANKGAYQGTAIYGDYVVQCFDRGYVNLFDLSAENKETPIAAFKLGSYNDGDEASRPAGETWDPSFYRNHANQAMFGAKKWDENDPFPLLYVTAGKKGWKMNDGSFIVRCAIERICYDEEKGWYAQTVQTIAYNDIAFTDQGTGREAMVKLKDGKFTYSGTADWPNTKQYEQPCWGWPAWFVDSDPTEVTGGKVYIHSARFCTAWSAVGNTFAGNFSNAIENFNYSDHNAYIITEFDMPALPEREQDFGQTVFLTPADITGQFTTEYDIWGTQGGTLYQGRIYYPFGFGWLEGQEDFLERRNGLRVYDIAQEKLIAKIELWEDSKMKASEPEGCAIYNGRLALSYNTGGMNLWQFEYVESMELPDPNDPAKRVTIDCLSGNILKEVE